MDDVPLLGANGRTALIAVHNEGHATRAGEVPTVEDVTECFDHHGLARGTRLH